VTNEASFEEVEKVVEARSEEVEYKPSEAVTDLEELD